MTIFEIGSLIVSILALIGSATAIFFMRKQSQEVLKYNYLSILPMLDMHTDTRTDTNTHTNTNPNTNKVTKTITKIITKTVILQNNGLGTAIIKKISLFTDGNIVDDKDPMNFIKNKILKGFSVEVESRYCFTLFKKGRGLLSGENITLIKMEFKDEPSKKDEEMFDKFELKINYESLDGKKYIYSSK